MQTPPHSTSSTEADPSGRRRSSRMSTRAFDRRRSAQAANAATRGQTGQQRGAHLRAGDAHGPADAREAVDDGSDPGRDQQEAHHVERRPMAERLVSGQIAPGGVPDCTRCSRAYARRWSRIPASPRRP